MSRAKVLRSPAEQASRSRPVVRLAAGRARVSKSAEPTRAKEEVKKKTMTGQDLLRDASIDGSSSDSSCSLSSVKTVELPRRRRPNRGVRIGKDVSSGVDAPDLLPHGSLGMIKRRCAWITANSDPLYVSFHDEEWGVPVHDDRKLFELLILSVALAELSWPTILSQRSTFREMLDDYNPASVADFSEKKTLTLKSSGGTFLSDQKLRAIVENARQVLKVAEEFGSFHHYCWSFVNNKPVMNGFRYPHKVPVKSPKAEVISRDLMRRGFRCVGPTVVYSFMQAAGIVNDHLTCCFRYKECNNLNSKENNNANVQETKSSSKAVDVVCTLHD